MNNVELWALSFVPALFVVHGIRLAFARRRPTPTIPAAKPMFQTLPAETTPLGSIPESVQVLLKKLREAEPQIISPDDRRNLAQIRSNVTSYFERRRLNRDGGEEQDVLIERLGILIDVVERYVDMQNNPDAYEYVYTPQLDLPEDRVELLKSGSKFIAAFVGYSHDFVVNDNRRGMLYFENDTRLLTDYLKKGQ